MKRFILGLAVLFSVMSFAQYSNGGSYWGDDTYHYEDDGYYFPEEYYYEYPMDYYSNSYYRDFYRDYRRSISMVDWNYFFYRYNLSPHQIRLILDLNSQFDSYYVWESYYRMNPVRWYYDRFYALEHILGTRLYIIFQNNYYRGIRPVVYYTNRCHHFYDRRYRVRRRYRRYNRDLFRVDRHRYHQNTGRRYGWRQSQNINRFRTNRNKGIRGNNGFRNQTNGLRNQTDGFRNQTNGTRNNNKGFRNPTRIRKYDTHRSLGDRSSVRNTTRGKNYNSTRVKTNATRGSSTKGFRNNTSRTYKRPTTSIRKSSSRSTTSHRNGYRSSRSSRGRR